MLAKERVVRDMYRGEVAWLVAMVQSKALGRRLKQPEMQVRGGSTLQLTFYGRLDWPLATGMKGG